ncbi:hypothetical protein V1478_007191, partial [Vespula squamosa]
MLQELRLFAKVIAIAVATAIAAITAAVAAVAIVATVAGTGARARAFTSTTSSGNKANVRASTPVYERNVEEPLFPRTPDDYEATTKPDTLFYNDCGISFEISYHINARAGGGCFDKVSSYFWFTASERFRRGIGCRR